jgi:hypothetical protein
MISPVAATLETAPLRNRSYLSKFFTSKPNINFQ